MAAFTDVSILSAYGLSYDLLRWRSASYIRNDMVLSMTHGPWSSEDTSASIVYFMTRIWRDDGEYVKILELLMEYFLLPSLSDLKKIMKALIPPGFETRPADDVYLTSMQQSRRSAFIGKASYDRREAFVLLIKTYLLKETVFTEQQQFTILHYALQLDGMAHDPAIKRGTPQDAYDRLTAPDMLNAESKNKKGQTAKEKKNKFFTLFTLAAEHLAKKMN